MVSDASSVVAVGSSSMITTVSLVEALALFLALSAKVSSLWKQSRSATSEKTGEIVTKIKKCGKGAYSSSSSSSSLRVEKSKSASGRGGGGGGAGLLGRLAEVVAVVFDDPAPVAGTA
jgi:hypothetical protein